MGKEPAGRAARHGFLLWNPATRRAQRAVAARWRQEEARQASRPPVNRAAHRLTAPAPVLVAVRQRLDDQLPRQLSIIPVHSRPAGPGISDTVFSTTAALVKQEQAWGGCATLSRRGSMVSTDAAATLFAVPPGRNSPPLPTLSPPPQPHLCLSSSLRAKRAGSGDSVSGFSVPNCFTRMGMPVSLWIMNLGFSVSSLVCLKAGEAAGSEGGQGGQLWPSTR